MITECDEKVVQCQQPLNFHSDLLS